MSGAGLFILFGAGGDLARKKLLAALSDFLLTPEGKDWYWIGVDLRSCTLGSVLEQCDMLTEQQRRVLEARGTYIPVVPNSTDSFVRLHEHIKIREARARIENGHRVCYLALPPHAFISTTVALYKAGIIKRQYHGQPSHRIMYEKPFGLSAEHAHTMVKNITEMLTLSQIALVDHYLGKAAILLLEDCRGKELLSAWAGRALISQIKVWAYETDHVQDRTLFYEGVGAERDMIQSHLFTVAHRALQKLYTDANGLAGCTVTKRVYGQYEGYRTHKGVSPHSLTETYASVTLYHPKKLPITLKSGKCLHMKEAGLSIHFAHPLQREGYKDSFISLLIQIQPQAGWYGITVSGKKIPLLEVTQEGNAYYEVLRSLVAHRTHGWVTIPEMLTAWQVLQVPCPGTLIPYQYPVGSKERKHREEYE